MRTVVQCHSILRSHVPFHVAAQFKAAQRRREEYLLTLHDNLPAFHEAIGRSHVSEAGVLQDTVRHNIRKPVTPLSLPLRWVETTTLELTRMLDGIVTAEAIAQQDYFLSAFIHPSYWRRRWEAAGQAPPSRRQQQDAAMPPELVRSGGLTLRVLQELSLIHASDADADSNDKDARNPPLAEPGPSVPALDVHQLLRAAVACGVPPLILFDSMAPSLASAPSFRVSDDLNGPARAVPESVTAEAFTALCGAINLVRGAGAVARLLDKYVPHSKTS